MTAVRHLAALLPTREDYRSVPRTWRGDLVAGITVAIIALPLALAFGVSSGAGAASGLVTAIVAGLVAAVFGGSNVQVSGPTGAMVVVLGPIVAAHETGAIAVVSLMAGAIVVVGGLLRLGRVVSYIPWPVIEGFTLGIAVIIFAQQVPAAVGTPAGESTIAVVAAAQALTHAGGSTALWPLVAVAVVAVADLAVQLGELVPRRHDHLRGVPHPAHSPRNVQRHQSPFHYCPGAARENRRQGAVPRLSGAAGVTTSERRCARARPRARSARRPAGAR